MEQTVHGNESGGGASGVHGGFEARHHTASVTGLVTALLAGASAAGLGSMLTDDTVRGALAAVEKSLVDLATAMQKAKEAQAQQPHLKRARTSVGPHKPPSYHHTHVHSGAPAPATRLSLDAIRHILNYVDSRRPSALTTAACVCKSWRDAVMHSDSLWTPAAHTLLPFTTQTFLAASKAVEDFLRSVGGNRALVMKYARAVVETAPTIETTRRHRTMVADWIKEPFQVIFELHDRLGGGILMSQVAEAGFVSIHDSDNDLPPHPYLHVTDDAAVHQREPFRVNDLLLPWEKGGDVDDLFTQTGRFISRVFAVSSRTGRLSLLHTTTLRDAFRDEADYDDDIWSYCSPSTTLSCAAAVGTDLKGSITFNVARQGADRFQVTSTTCIQFEASGGGCLQRLRMCCMRCCFSEWVASVICIYTDCL